MKEVIYRTSLISANQTWETKNKKVNAILFRNAGDVDITINNEPVAAGSTYQVINNGLDGDIDTTNYKIFFDSATAGTAPKVVIREKIYK